MRTLALTSCAHSHTLCALHSRPLCAQSNGMWCERRRSKCSHSQFACVMRAFTYVICAYMRLSRPTCAHSHLMPAHAMRAYAMRMHKRDRIRIACTRLRCECTHLRGIYVCVVMHVGILLLSFWTGRNRKEFGDCNGQISHPYGQFGKGGMADGRLMTKR